MSGWIALGMRRSLSAAAALGCTVCLLMLVPTGAGAATVVNGNFETGTLSGWSTVPANPFEVEEGWFAYSGTVAPVSAEEDFEEEEIFFREVPSPPQGNFAAISDENGPGLHILYQDVALEPGLSQALSMLVYYHSEAEIVSPDTLSPDAGPNQQYRVDVMKPGAPIDSVNPADILAPVFRTTSGAPQTLGPTQVTANLTPFAGQTVRIRMAEVDNLFYFNAGVDAVSLSSQAPPPPPSNLFSFGKLQLNKKNGTGQLQVAVPGPGTLTATPPIAKTVKAKASAYASKLKAVPKKIKSATTTVTVAGTATLKVKPTAAGKKILKERGKLSFSLNVTFTPTGGTAATQTFTGKLKLTPKPQPKPKKG